MTYVNTSFFAISLLPISVRLAREQGLGTVLQSIKDVWRSRFHRYETIVPKVEDEDLLHPLTSSEVDLVNADSGVSIQRSRTSHYADEALTIGETAFLSFEFCLLWFIANYFVAACLAYTSVASSTILTSTSSIWTLLFGSLVGVEEFTFRKLFGVLASLAGIILISSVDLSGNNDDSRGSFPHKERAQIAIGDAMAFFSAIMYGLYTVVMKKRIGNEDRVNMPLFFGLVGLFNMIFLWPGFFILHYTAVEPFVPPPTAKIWLIVMVCLLPSYHYSKC
jgi:solute carrier family 35 protein F5